MKPCLEWPPNQINPPTKQNKTKTKNSQTNKKEWWGRVVLRIIGYKVLEEDKGNTRTTQKIGKKSYAEVLHWKRREEGD